MNFLAHLYLSGDDPEIMVGNFIADGVKGKNMDRFSEGIQKGIRLHRFIDNFTDVHAETIKAINILRPFTGRYSPVAVDLVFDHVLARDWAKHSDDELEVFVDKAYSVLDEYRVQFPEHVDMMYGYMRRDNWLVGYASPEGIDWAFRGLSRRVRHENELDRGLEAIENHDDEFSAIFENFLPDISRGVEEWLIVANR